MHSQTESGCSINDDDDVAMYTKRTAIHTNSVEIFAKQSQDNASCERVCVVDQRGIIKFILFSLKISNELLAIPNVLRLQKYCMRVLVMDNVIECTQKKAAGVCTFSCIGIFAWMHCITFTTLAQ